VLNQSETFTKYLKRLQTLEPKEFNIFEGAFISDFGLAKIPNKADEGMYVHHAQICLYVAKELDVGVKGFISENKSKGLYIDPKRETENVVYVGKTSRYTELKPTLFSLLPEDLVYV
jgi:hypothetical protein